MLSTLGEEPDWGGWDTLDRSIFVDFRDGRTHQSENINLERPEADVGCWYYTAWEYIAPPLRLLLSIPAAIYRLVIE